MGVQNKRKTIRIYIPKLEDSEVYHFERHNMMMTTKLLIGLSMVIVLISSHVSKVDGGWTCKTSKCSIYASGCIKPWVDIGKTRCFGFEVDRATTLQRVGDDNPFLPKYKYTCCKIVNRSPPTTCNEWKIRMGIC